MKQLDKCAACFSLTAIILRAISLWAEPDLILIDRSRALRVALSRVKSQKHRRERRGDCGRQQGPSGAERCEEGGEAAKLASSLDCGVAERSQRTWWRISTSSDGTARRTRFVYPPTPVHAVTLRHDPPADCCRTQKKGIQITR